MSIQRVADNWGWFLAFGAALVLLGFIALGEAFAVTIGAVVFYGVLLLMGSGAQLVHAFYHRDWAGFLLGIALAVLYALAGMALIARPVVGAEILTLVLGLSIAVNGVARIVLAFMHRRFAGWLAMALSGVVSLFLGGTILAHWPESSLFVIGLFIGIDLIFNGASWIALGLTARQFRSPADGQPSPIA